MTERQTIVTWYTPEEKKPEEEHIVVASVSGNGKNITYNHAFALAEWYDDEYGWTLTEANLDSFTVHAWCALIPYGSGKEEHNVNNT